VPDFEPWSPEHPKLYDFTVTCGDDSVEQLFCHAQIFGGAGRDGVKRLFLNGRPYFHNGLLDQGYWPDGLYTAPSDEAMVFDIQLAKDMGFNMLQQAHKGGASALVLPLRRSGHAGLAGHALRRRKLLPRRGLHSSGDRRAHKGQRLFLFGRGEKDGRDEFEQELRDMVTQLYNCPCIAMWVPFNEGWGQFDSQRLCET
jgi:beta-galactosidase/beta-glucuronidase